MFTRTKEEEEELYKITTEYISKINELSGQLKAEITNNEKVLEVLLKDTTRIENEEKIKKYLNDNTEEKIGENVSYVYVIHRLMKNRMKKKHIIEIIKENYEVKEVEVNDVKMKCLMNRGWKVGKKELKENS
jgi:hypothetical protein